MTSLLTSRDRPGRPLRGLLTIAAVAVLAVACSKTEGTGTHLGGEDLADNGVANLVATEILDKTKAALPDAESVRISGAGVTDGEKVEMDFRFKGREGGTGWGTFGGEKIEITRIGQDVYLKADEAFWADMTDDPEGAKELAGKYLKTTADDAEFKFLTIFTDLSQFGDYFLKPDGGSYTKVEGKEVRGVQTVGLKESGPRGLTLYVAAEGPAYPLQMTSDKPDDTGTLDFVEYGEPVELPEPPADQVVDLNEV